MKEDSSIVGRRLSRSGGTACSVRKRRPLRVVLIFAAAMAMFLWLSGCSTLSSAINVGKWKGVERAGSDEEYYLAKDIFLTAGSAASQRNAFDHNMHESVNLFFIPRNETNTYVAETIWYDPAGVEYRAIRKTYDRQRETAKGDEREKAGTTRVHSMSTKELYTHKPGSWKVALYLDNKLVRRMDFTVR
ncbi:MAG: hypothetical protein HY913_01460 [Desulfomonile tiedjei]|nr:hypothetical protein [Desulfomonile tiedjei]